MVIKAGKLHRKLASAGGGSQVYPVTVKMSLSFKMPVGRGICKG